jgi:hypothetical protein
MKQPCQCRQCQIEQCNRRDTRTIAALEKTLGQFDSDGPISRESIYERIKYLKNAIKEREVKG